MLVRNNWGEIIYSEVLPSRPDFLTIITTNSQRNYFLQIIIE